MFTGIIHEVASIQAITTVDDANTVTLACTQSLADDLEHGDSICVNGVCLTVCKIKDNIIYVNVSKETLKCTTFRHLKKDMLVNVEPALTPSSKVSGHLVHGHVDALGEVRSLKNIDECMQCTIAVPKKLSTYIVEKGSVAVDGVSLTVNYVKDNFFDVNLIPYTIEHTIASEYKNASTVNIEIDRLALHIEKILHGSTNLFKIYKFLK
jgi:riboflavin synthase